jgi:hypothetical protein
MKKKVSKLFTPLFVLRQICLILVLSANTYAGGIKDFLKPEKVIGEIKEEVAEMDISLDAKLLDLELAKGVGLSSKYKYEVEPSYKAKYFTRVDSWKLNVDLKPGDIIRDSIDLPIFLNISRGKEIKFIRQFPSKKKALTRIPYTLLNTPLNAKKALDLEVGDFVSIPSRLNIAMGVNLSQSAGAFRAGAQYYVMFSGEFLIHVFRMKDNKVRLKIIAHREKSRNTKVNAEIAPSFDIFGISILDKQINKFTKLTLADFGIKKAEGQQFIIDYIFDLDNEDARKAYNQVLNSSHKLKGLQMLKSNVDMIDIQEKLISSYILADTLSEQDADKEVLERRVDRIFKGFNDYSQKLRRFKMGLVVSRFSKEKSSMENHITYEDKDGSQHSYYYPTQHRKRETKADLLILKRKERIQKTAFGLVPMDSNGVGGEHTDFGFIYERKDNVFTFEEQKLFHQLVSDTLPATSYEKIDWKGLNNFKRKRGVTAHLQVIFKQDAFKHLQGISYEELKEKLYRHVDQRQLFSITPIDGLFRKVWRKVKHIREDESKRITDIAEELHIIFNSQELDGKQKIKRLLDLRDKRIFKKLGMSFLMSLLSEEDLDKYVFFDFQYKTNDSELVHYRFGTQGFSKIYKEIQYVHKVIQNRSHDLRLTEIEADFKEKGSL